MALINSYITAFYRFYHLFLQLFISWSNVDRIHTQRDKIEKHSLPLCVHLEFFLAANVYLYLKNLSRLFMSGRPWPASSAYVPLTRSLQTSSSSITSLAPFVQKCTPYSRSWMFLLKKTFQKMLQLIDRLDQKGSVCQFVSPFVE